MGSRIGFWKTAWRIRAGFEENMKISDPAAIDALVEEGEQMLFDNIVGINAIPYTIPWLRGGTSFMRNPPLVPHLDPSHPDYHPLDESEPFLPQFDAPETPEEQAAANRKAKNLSHDHGHGHGHEAVHSDDHEKDSVWSLYKPLWNSARDGINAVVGRVRGGVEGAGAESHGKHASASAKETHH